MQDDERCCGTGTCIIDAQGHCWCGQQWDGEKMCRPATAAVSDAATGTAANSKLGIDHSGDFPQPDTQANPVAKSATA